MEKLNIPVARPTIGAREKELVAACMDTGWISSVGTYVTQFEHKAAEILGARHALSVCNGTAALHLALMGLGIGPGDEIILPAVTYIATANCVSYCGATPVLADVDPVTLNLTAETVARAITPRTRAIMPVHLFGLPCDMTAIMDLARSHGLFVVEDAAEAIGSRWDGKSAGTFGDIGMFSFFGNKTITTGEGGMLVTDDDALAERCLLLRGQGMSQARRYWHPIIGYNYRMTNICAAIGLGQIETLDRKIALRRTIRQTYAREIARHGLGNRVLLPEDPALAFSSVWMVNVLLHEGTTEAQRDAVMAALAARGIETRPTFYPLYQMPPYSHLSGPMPGAEGAMRGIVLPTFESLTEAEIIDVVTALAGALPR